MRGKSTLNAHSPNETSSKFKRTTEMLINSWTCKTTQKMVLVDWIAYIAAEANRMIYHFNVNLKIETNPFQMIPPFEKNRLFKMIKWFHLFFGIWYIDATTTADTSSKLDLVLFCWSTKHQSIIFFNCANPLHISWLNVKRMIWF